jgi:hypothetical protein
MTSTNVGFNESNVEVSGSTITFNNYHYNSNANSDSSNNDSSNKRNAPQGSQKSSSPKRVKIDNDSNDDRQAPQKSQESNSPKRVKIDNDSNDDRKKIKSNGKEQEKLRKTTNWPSYLSSLSCRHIMVNAALNPFYQTSFPQKNCTHRHDTNKGYDNCFQNAIFICVTCTLANQSMETVWVCGRCMCSKEELYNIDHNNLGPSTCLEEILCGREDSHHVLKGLPMTYSKKGDILTPDTNYIIVLLVASYIRYIQKNMQIINIAYNWLMTDLNSVIPIDQECSESSKLSESSKSSKSSVSSDPILDDIYEKLFIDNKREPRIAGVPIKQSNIAPPPRIEIAQHAQNDENGRDVAHEQVKNAHDQEGDQNVQSTTSISPSEPVLTSESTESFVRHQNSDDSDDSVDSSDSHIQTQAHDQEGDRGQNVQGTTSVPQFINTQHDQNDVNGRDIVQIQNPSNYKLSYDSIQYITDPRGQNVPSTTSVPPIIDTVLERSPSPSVDYDGPGDSSDSSDSNAVHHFQEFQMNVEGDRGQHVPSTTSVPPIIDTVLEKSPPDGDGPLTRTLSDNSGLWNIQDVEEIDYDDLKDKFLGDLSSNSVYSLSRSCTPFDSISRCCSVSPLNNYGIC